LGLIEIVTSAIPQPSAPLAEAHARIGWGSMLPARKAAMMGHTIRDRTKLLARVRRIVGQCEAIALALESERGCSETLQLIAGARGAMNGLMAEVLEQHLRTHVLDGASPRSRDEAAGELIDVVRAYLK